MKVKMLVSRSGPEICDNAGDEVEVIAEEGKRMVDAGQAVAVKATKPTEKATKKGRIETTAK